MKTLHLLKVNCTVHKYCSVQLSMKHSTDYIIVVLYLYYVKEGREIIDFENNLLDLVGLFLLIPIILTNFLLR